MGIGEIGKNRRDYIREYFKDSQSFNDGDIIVFEMPPMYTILRGDYSAVVYLDSDGDPYVDKMESFFRSCRDYYIRVNEGVGEGIVFTYDEVEGIVNKVMNIGMNLRQDQLLGYSSISGAEVIREYMKNLKVKKL